MACYSPRKALRTIYKNQDTGKDIIKIVGPYDPETETGDINTFIVPCGKCLGCRLDRARMWSDRMALELDHWKKGMFITLTYNEDNVPLNSEGYRSLNKNDWVLFMKRLRKHFEVKEKFFNEDTRRWNTRVTSRKEFKFFACGEYGSHTFRPHMHACLFGLSLEDFSDRKLKGVNELKQAYYISEEFSKIWDKGFVILSDISYQTMNYVARYIVKKVAGETDKYITENKVEPEWQLMSRRPGLGALYLEDHPELKDIDYFNLPGKQKMPMPTFLINKLEKDFPDRYNELKIKRMSSAKISAMNSILDYDYLYRDNLQIQQSFKKLDTKILQERELALIN